MVWMNAGASQFNHLCRQRFVGCEVKFASAIVAKISLCGRAGLQPVSCHHRADAFVSHNEMITEGIELIYVFAGGVSMLQSFIELKVKDPEAQLINRVTVFK